MVLMATGITAAPVWEAISAVPDFALPNWPSRERVPSGKMPSKRPELTISLALSIAPVSPAPRLTGKAPSCLPKNQAPIFLENSSALAMKKTCRFWHISRYTGSISDIWLAQIISRSSGEKGGIFSFPMAL